MKIMEEKLVKIIEEGGRDSRRPVAGLPTPIGSLVDHCPRRCRSSSPRVRTSLSATVVRWVGVNRWGQGPAIERKTR